jgi:hypothetical protein
METKIPKVISIKGKLWKISFRKRIKLDGVDCDGLCESGKRLILLRSGLTKKDLIHTFLHEYFHAVLHELHVDVDGGLEEVIVDGMASCLLENFKLSLLKK